MKRGGDTEQGSCVTLLGDAGDVLVREAKVAELLGSARNRDLRFREMCLCFQQGTLGARPFFHQRLFSTRVGLPQREELGGLEQVGFRRAECHGFNRRDHFTLLDAVTEILVHLDDDARSAGRESGVLVGVVDDLGVAFDLLAQITRSDLGILEARRPGDGRRRE